MLVHGEPLPGPGGDFGETNVKAGVLVEGFAGPGRDPQETLWSPLPVLGALVRADRDVVVVRGGLLLECERLLGLSKSILAGGPGPPTR
jgi:hypothetical protein